MSRTALAIFNATALCLALTACPVRADGGARPEVRVFADARDPMAITSDPLPEGPVDLESLTLTLKNTSGELIYFARVTVILPEALFPDGVPWGFAVGHGRSELLLDTELPRSDDLPIAPGESVRVTIPAEQYGWFEHYFLDRDHKLPTLTRIHVTLMYATFADQRIYTATAERFRSAPD